MSNTFAVGDRDHGLDYLADGLLRVDDLDTLAAERSGLQVGDRVVVESNIISWPGMFYDYVEGGCGAEPIGDEGVITDIDGDEVAIAGDGGVHWTLHRDSFLKVDDLPRLAAERSGLQVGDRVVVESNIVCPVYEEGGLGAVPIGDVGEVAAIRGDRVEMMGGGLSWTLHRDSFLKVDDLPRLAAERAPSFASFTDGPLLEWERELLECCRPTEVAANAEEGNGKDHGLAEGVTLTGTDMFDANAAVEWAECAALPADNPKDERRAALKEAAALITPYGFSGRDLVALADYILTGDVR